MQRKEYLAVYRVNKKEIMKNLKLTSTLVLALVLISSCKKEPVPTPTPQTNCSTCNCLEWDSTGVNQITSNTTYGSVFYFQANASMSAKYVDYSMLANGSGSVSSIPVDAIWQAENSNYSGEILLFADVDVLFDYSTYPSAYKALSFDFNGNLGDFTFKVDGNNYTSLPSGVSYTLTNLTNGYHIELSGPFSNVELGGWELAIDNMCIANYTPGPNTGMCQDFEDTTFISSCPTAQTSFGSPFYAVNGITFRTRYVDYEGISSLPGSVHWGAPSSFGSGQHVNFNGQLLQVNNCDLEINFSALAYTNKKVEFDISNLWTVDDANEFMVNGNPLSSLPAGVTYSIVNSGIAGNGNPCYHVTIEGPINTIVLVGWEITYDNLCVEQL